LAGILAVLSSQQGLEPPPQKHFSRLLVFSASHAVYRLTAVSRDEKQEEEN